MFHQIFKKFKEIPKKILETENILGAFSLSLAHLRSEALPEIPKAFLRILRESYEIWRKAGSYQTHSKNI